MDNIMNFLHIPKTAGQSVAKAIGDPSKYLGHKRIRDIYSDDDVITVVRNPYDRAVSMYYYLKNIQGDAPQLKGLFATLNGFWNQIYNAPKSGIEHTHMKPQMWFISDEDGNISSQVTTIWRYETLNTQLDEMVGNFGFSKLEVINKSELRPDTTWLDELNEESIKQIGELYADDFEHLNYRRL